MLEKIVSNRILIVAYLWCAYAMWQTASLRLQQLAAIAKEKTIDVETTQTSTKILDFKGLLVSDTFADTNLDPNFTFVELQTNLTGSNFYLADATYIGTIKILQNSGATSCLVHFSAGKLLEFLPGQSTFFVWNGKSWSPVNGFPTYLN